jgi:hypothetical protein
MRTTFTYSILFGLFLMTVPVSGQTYHFSAESAEYEPIQGGQLLVNDTWDDPELQIPIGFSFDLFTSTIQQLNLRANFTIVSLASSPDAQIYSLMLLFGADLIDRGFFENTPLSPIKYLVTGNTGSRVLTVEWENAGFFGDLYADSISTDFVNFQLKLYEENGDIVFHFGPSSVTDPFLAYSGFEGTSVGIAEDYNELLDEVDGEIILLSGNPSDPDVNTDYGEYILNATIPENTVYRFSRESTSTITSKYDFTKQFYTPNPTRGNLVLNTEILQEDLSAVHVYDMTGQRVKLIKEAGYTDLSDLPAGVYELRFQWQNAPFAERIMVMPE